MGNQLIEREGIGVRMAWQFSLGVSPPPKANREIVQRSIETTARTRIRLPFSSSKLPQRCKSAQPARQSSVPFTRYRSAQAFDGARRRALLLHHACAASAGVVLLASLIPVEISVQPPLVHSPRDQSVVPDDRSGKALILLVERDDAIRTLERYFLEQAGFEVQFASDGIEALKLAQRTKPNILVSEILVPSLDGLSLCRALKAEPATRSILILMFSMLAVAERAYEAGADAFLLKPLNDRLLVETVEKLLQQSVRQRFK